VHGPSLSGPQDCRPERHPVWTGTPQGFDASDKILVQHPLPDRAWPRGEKPGRVPRDVSAARGELRRSAALPPYRRAAVHLACIILNRRSLAIFCASALPRSFGYRPGMAQTESGRPWLDLPDDLAVDSDRGVGNALEKCAQMSAFQSKCRGPGRAACEPVDGAASSA